MSHPQELHPLQTVVQLRLSPSERNPERPCSKRFARCRGHCSDLRRLFWSWVKVVVSAVPLRFHLVWRDRCPAELNPVGVPWPPELLLDHPMLHQRCVVLDAPGAADISGVGGLRDHQLRECGLTTAGAVLLLCLTVERR